MRSYFFLLACYFALAFSGNAGEKYPQEFFEWPIRHAVRVSGTFGELRANHFHSGIDLKSSTGSVGDPLYAAGDGYVSRVKVDGGGYGNALYIEHPNGYTTVYAHLLSFSPEIAAYVEDMQYKEKSFEVDLYLDKTQFPIKRGQPIGKMGTTGFSFGPHLHFEIRDAQTEEPINPLLFGLEMTDEVKPSLRALKLYELNEKGETINSQVEYLRGSGQNYRLRKDTVVVKSNHIGLALKAYDLHNYVNNLNGFYNLDLYLDDTLIYRFNFERFAFEDTRYLNAHMDYADRVLRTSYFSRLFRLPGNQLPIYQQMKNDGILHLPKNKARNIRIEVSDVPGNTSTLETWIKWDGTPRTVPDRSYDYELFHAYPNVIQTDYCRVHFPDNCFYEDIYFQFAVSDDGSNNYYSLVHHLHQPAEPVHRYYDLALRPNRTIPEGLKEKAFIAYCEEGGAIVNCGGEWQEGMLHAQVRTLGDFAIHLDQVPPTIRALNARVNMRGQRSLRFNVQDNYETARNVEYLHYEGYMDGQWVLLQYDAKSDLLWHEFDANLRKGPHLFELVVHDAVGNRTNYQLEFQY